MRTVEKLQSWLRDDTPVENNMSGNCEELISILGNGSNTAEHDMYAVLERNCRSENKRHNRKHQVLKEDEDRGFMML